MCYRERGDGKGAVIVAIQALTEVGVAGFVLDDHVPRLIDDTAWGRRGRAYATGYSMALLVAVNRLG